MNVFGKSRRPVVAITDPCFEDWNAMPIGGDGQRYCQRCKKSVHNLADMTGKEVRQLFAQGDGRVCVHALYDENGELVLRRESSRFAGGLIPIGVLSAATAVVPNAGLAQASEPSSCRVEVSVQDPSKAAVPNSEIQFNDGSSNGTVALQGRSDTAGIFTGELKPGPYTMSVQQIGFSTSKEVVQVRCSDSSSLMKVSVPLQVGLSGGGMICKRPNVLRRSWTKLSARLRTTKSTN